MFSRKDLNIEISEIYSASFLFKFNFENYLNALESFDFCNENVFLQI